MWVFLQRHSEDNEVFNRLTGFPGSAQIVIMFQNISNGVLIPGPDGSHGRPDRC